MNPSAAKLLSSLFGIGYVPFAPGTFGTAFAAVVYFFFLSDLSAAEFAVFCAIFSGAAIFICGSAADAFGAKDPSRVVMDEAAGFFTAMIFSSGRPLEITAGFVFFRFFDIVKIYPSRRIEKLPKGWGIVLDDIYAGFLAAACVAILKFSSAAEIGHDALDKFLINF